MNVSRMSVVAHSGKREALEVARALTKWLVERNVEVVNDEPDLVVSLGGDGTMLRAAQHAHANDAPLLGVNLGTLGYLSEVEMGEEKEALERVFEGDFELEERMMLRCRVVDGDERTFVGLNEVLVERAARHRLVRLNVSIGGESLASFNADGVIVATPTGSTAYALSAGGPIVSPRAQCLILVPVSPHLLLSRPFVVAPDVHIEISADEGQEASLSLDGAIGCELAAGARVLVERHPVPLRLVRLAGPGFLERLRSKMGLPG